MELTVSKIKTTDEGHHISFLRDIVIDHEILGKVIQKQPVQLKVQGEISLEVDQKIELDPAKWTVSVSNWINDAGDGATTFWLNAL